MTGRSYPYNHKFRQRIQSDVAGVSPDMAFLSHLVYVNPAEASSDGIATLALGAAIKTVLIQGLGSIDYPRALCLVANVSGVTGNVEIVGTNYVDEVITETISASGTTTKYGEKAFRKVTSIKLPVQTHTPAAQTETIEVTNECTQDGSLSVSVTSEVLGDDSPVALEVPVTSEMDTVTDVAEAIVAGLNDDDIVSAFFTASNEAGEITLTANKPAANDVTLAIAVTVGGTGVTVGASTNGVTGVPCDIISVGWSETLGLPYRLHHNTILKTYLGNIPESVAPTVKVSKTDIEENTVTLNSSLDADKNVDIYLIV